MLYKNMIFLPKKTNVKEGERRHRDQYHNWLEDGKYVTWVPDVVSYKLYELCVVHYTHSCLTGSTNKSVFLQRKSAWITNRRNNRVKILVGQM